MRAYVKSVTVRTCVLVDIDTGEKFTVSANSLQKLFGVVPQEGEVLGLSSGAAGRHCRSIQEVAGGAAGGAGAAGSVVMKHYSRSDV
jgi:hypothetical protein